MLLLLIGAVFLITLLVFTLFSVEKIFMILTFYISSFAIHGYLVYFAGLPLVYTVRVSYPLFALLLIYWLIHLSRNRESFRSNQMDIAVLIFIAAMLLGVANGFLQRHNRSFFIRDTISLPFVLSYFIK